MLKSKKIGEKLWQIGSDLPKFLPPKFLPYGIIYCFVHGRLIYKDVNIAVL